MIKLSQIWNADKIQSHIDSGYHLVKCPVCGNETFDNWAICPHCNWEHDEFLHRGYSCANATFIWWYKIKYKVKKLFKNS